MKATLKTNENGTVTCCLTLSSGKQYQSTAGQIWKAIKDVADQASVTYDSVSMIAKF
jgi:hypothetical protein